MCTEAGSPLQRRHLVFHSSIQLAGDSSRTVAHHVVEGQVEGAEATVNFRATYVHVVFNAGTSVPSVRSRDIGQAIAAEAVPMVHRLKYTTRMAARSMAVRTVVRPMIQLTGMMAVTLVYRHTQTQASRAGVMYSYCRTMVILKHTLML